MKKNGQMLRAGIPSVGQRSKFKGFRRKHWREKRIVEGHDDRGLPIVRYVPEPVIVMQPIRAIRERLWRQRRDLRGPTIAALRPRPKHRLDALARAVLK